MNNLIETLSAKIDNIFNPEISDEEKEEEYKSIIEEYRKSLYLPEKDLTDPAKYYSKAYKLNHDLLENSDLGLTLLIISVRQ